VEGNVKQITRLLIIAPLFGCVPDDMSFENKIDQAILQSQPYIGITRNSYGMLSQAPIQLCDPYTSTEPGILGLAIGAASKTITKPDASVSKEGLQHLFAIASMPGIKNVAFIEREKERFTVWYQVGPVSPKEVAAAGKEYCTNVSTKIKRHAVYDGSASHCGKTTQLPVIINNKRPTVTPTYAIASFKCSKN
jgi:hypothetical protein